MRHRPAKFVSSKAGRAGTPKRGRPYPLDSPVFPTPITRYARNAARPILPVCGRRASWRGLPWAGGRMLLSRRARRERLSSLRARGKTPAWGCADAAQKDRPPRARESGTGNALAFIPFLRRRRPTARRTRQLPASRRASAGPSAAFSRTKRGESARSLLFCLHPARFIGGQALIQAFFADFVSTTQAAAATATTAIAIGNSTPVVGVLGPGFSVPGFSVPLPPVVL